MAENVTYFQSDDLFHVGRPDRSEMHLESKFRLCFDNSVFCGEREVISQIVHAIHTPSYRQKRAVTQEYGLCVLPTIKYTSHTGEATCYFPHTVKRNESGFDSAVLWIGQELAKIKFWYC